MLERVTAYYYNKCENYPLGRGRHTHPLCAGAINKGCRGAFNSRLNYTGAHRNDTFLPNRFARRD